MPDRVKDYLAAIGKKGGEAGKGQAKRRPQEQYKAMAKKSAETRRNKKSVYRVYVAGVAPPPTDILAADKKSAIEQAYSNQSTARNRQQSRNSAAESGDDSTA